MPFERFIYIVLRNIIYLNELIIIYKYPFLRDNFSTTITIM